MRAHYRIVEDAYAGYEVQSWRLWWPFWVSAGGVNTFSSVEMAEKYANVMAGRIVKNLGALP